MKKESIGLSLRQKIFAQVNALEPGDKILLRDHSERTMAHAAAVERRKDWPLFMIKTGKAAKGRGFEVERVR